MKGAIQRIVVVACLAGAWGLWAAPTDAQFPGTFTPMMHAAAGRLPACIPIAGKVINVNGKNRYTFTYNNQLNCLGSRPVRYCIIAGGGAGGNTGGPGGAGGGGGGMLIGQGVLGNENPILIGQGGTYNAATAQGNSGGDTQALGRTALGGGGGGGLGAATFGRDGGAGGGSSYPPALAGIGSQGGDGGRGLTGTYTHGGGGGGGGPEGEKGEDGRTTGTQGAGKGGDGSICPIDGQRYAGGGGGVSASDPPPYGAPGGLGGGGQGANVALAPPANSGGGSGGCYGCYSATAAAGKVIIEELNEGEPPIVLPCTDHNQNGTIANTIALFHFDSENSLASSVGNRRSATLTGAASISEIQVRFGDAALATPSAVSAANLETTADLILGPGSTGSDLTWEGWLYDTNPTRTYSSVYGDGVTFSVDTRSNPTTSGFFGNNGYTVYNWTLPNRVTEFANRWFHLAYVRRNKVWHIFFDGNEILPAWTPGAGADPWGVAGYVQQIGNFGGGNGNYQWIGYIDEVRISNVARYAENFTPPASAFCDRSPLTGWQTVWSAPNVISSGAGWTNYQLRTNVDSSLFFLPTTDKATQLRITYAGQGFTTPSTVNSSFVGHAASNNLGVMDFDGSQAQITVNGDTNWTIPAGGEVVSDPINYPFDQNKNLVVSTGWGSYAIAAGPAMTGITTGSAEGAGAAGNAGPGLTIAGFSYQNTSPYVINKIEAFYGTP